MEYKLANGRIIQIDDAIIQKSMKSLDLSTEEAIELYLDDNGFTENAEQSELDAKAKKVKIKHGAYEEKVKKKAPKSRKTPVSDEKKQIFSDILAFLSEKYGGNVEIVKENKLILVNLPNNRPIKIDIIQQRPPKK